MDISGALISWVAAAVAIPLIAYTTRDDESQLLTADVALNFVVFHGVTKILSVFISSYVSVLIEAAALGVIYIMSHFIGGGNSSGLSGLYSTSFLGSFERVALILTWVYFVFETWQVSRTAWNLPNYLKRIFEEIHDRSEEKANEDSYWTLQDSSPDDSTLWEKVLEFFVVAACFCLCIVSIWLHSIAYPPDSPSSITALTGYIIIIVEVVTVALGFKASNGMFIGAICNTAFVSFNLYRGCLVYNQDHISSSSSSWKQALTRAVNDAFSSQNNMTGATGDVSSVPGTLLTCPVAFAVSALLAGLVAFLFVLEFLVGEKAAADEDYEERCEREVDKEMAKICGESTGYMADTRLKEMEIALVQYLVEGLLMVACAGAVISTCKGVGPGYYARLVQSMILIGAFVQRICNVVLSANTSHAKSE